MATLITEKCCSLDHNSVSFYTRVDLQTVAALTKTPNKTEIVRALVALVSLDC